MEYKITVDGAGASYTDEQGNVVTYDGDDGLFKFTSTDAGQAALGDKEWIGIALTLDEAISENITWNGTAFTAEEAVAEIAGAQSVGYTDDKTMIFWTRYDALPKTIKLGTADGSKNEVEITFSK